MVGISKITNSPPPSRSCHGSKGAEHHIEGPLDRMRQSNYRLTEAVVRTNGFRSAQAVGVRSWSR
jgi:hypothetical protein